MSNMSYCRWQNTLDDLRDWPDKSWLRGGEPRALEVIGWAIGWAVFLGLLFVMMHHEPALRC